MSRAERPSYRADYPGPAIRAKDIPVYLKRKITPASVLVGAFFAILISLGAIAMAVNALAPGAAPSHAPIVNAPASWNLQKNVNT
jgi:hypothetical protein